MNNKNVLMVCLDGARVDMLDTSKELSLLFGKGTLFSECIVSAPYTVASMHSIMTGMHGHRNGVDAYNNMFKLKKASKTLAEYMNEQGYYTHADMISEAVLSERGFNKWTIHDENSLNSAELLKYHREIIGNAHKSGNNFFIFLQYSKIHTESITNIAKKFNDLDEIYYTPDQNEENKNNFLSYMKEAGIYASGLIQYLKDLGISDDTLVIFFSDHGTSLGEKYGEKMYGSFVYDYTIKTFFHFLNPLFPSTKIETQVRCIDIMPTILDLLKIDPDSESLSLQGESLLSLISYHEKNSFYKYFTKKPKDRIAYVETGGLGGLWPSPTSPNVKCVRTGKWKLIHNLKPNTFEFYDLEKDPLEEQNLFGIHPKIQNKLMNYLKRMGNDSA